MTSKTFQGVTFKIDRPKGTVKKWDQPSGPPKVFVYPVDYGYFPGIKGEDGEGLDAFVGDAQDGHLEVFQKLKKDERGRLVLDETKFLVGVTDAQRETIYRLYGDQVWARRVFHDVNELQVAAQRFKGAKKDRYREKTAEDDADNHDVRNAAMLAAGVSPFMGLIGQRALIHDPVTNADIKRMTHAQLRQLARPGDLVATSAAFSPYKPPQRAMTGSEFFHVEPIVGRHNGQGYSLEAGRAFAMGGPSLDKPRSSRKLQKTREAYGRYLDHEDMVLLRPKKKLSPAELRTYLDESTRVSMAKYRTPQVVSAWMHDVFVPKIGKGRVKLSPDCEGGICSTGTAKALAKIQRDVLHGKSPSTMMPADFLRSDKFEAVGASLTNELKKPTLARRLMPYAARAALGTLLAGGVAAAAYEGSKLYRRLKRPEADEPKLAASPATNAHADQGTYRFNRRSFTEGRQHPFARIDSRMADSGDESAQGLVFEEGVVA